MSTLSLAKRMLLILVLVALATVQGGLVALNGSPERAEQLKLVCSGDSGNNCGGGPG